MNSPLSLCEQCGWVRVIRTPKGSRFLLCRRAEQDPRFPKYPPQPLARCFGFQPLEGPGSQPSSGPANDDNRPSDHEGSNGC